MSAIRCPRHYCGLFLEPTTDGMGRVAFACAGCARNRRGLCRDCPRALGDTRRMRCLRCAAVRSRAADTQRDRARYAKRRKAVLAHHRSRQAIPEIREHRRQYMATYRATHPRDGFDRAYQRVYMAACRADPQYRAKQNARKRELRALKKLERAA